MIEVKLEDEFDFLYTSHVIEYRKDNYNRRDDDIIGELEQGVRNLRRRYNNQMDYIGAIAKYNEYLGMLIAKHGGKKMFKIKYKNGDVKEYIPHKPRMKNTKLNKKLMENKIIMSDTGNVKIDIEGATNSANTLDEEMEINIIDSNDVEIEKMLEKGFKLNKSDMLSDNTSIDHLEAYFARKRNKGKSYVRYEEDDRPSLTDYLTDNVVDIDDEENDQDILFYQGSMLNRDNVKQMKIMEDLKSQGWNTLKIMRKNLNKNKSVTKIMKKRERKIKKVSKKKAKEYSSYMSDMIGDNMSFQDFEEDILDLSTKNIFK